MHLGRAGVFFWYMAEGVSEQVKLIKDFRLEVDGLVKLAAYYKANPISINESPRGAREMALVHTKLQEAKMWLGMALADMGYTPPAEFLDEVPSEGCSGIA
jgi:hypothetical protein